MPEVVLILPVMLVPVGVIDVILGSIISNGTFCEMWSALPPPVLVISNGFPPVATFRW